MLLESNLFTTVYDNSTAKTIMFLTNLRINLSEVFNQ